MTLLEKLQGFATPHSAHGTLTPNAGAYSQRVHAHARCPCGVTFKRGQVRMTFATALKRAGITGFLFHDLRHTAVRHMVMRGSMLQEVKEVLVHSEIKMTLR